MNSRWYFLFKQIHVYAPNAGQYLSDRIEPAKEWMRRNTNFAYPIQLVTKFEGEDAMIGFLLELLTLENDDFSPQKKLQLLSHLQNHTHPSICPAILPYLKDFNEDVRFATIEAIAIQKDPQAITPLLEQMEQEASNRLRHRIAFRLAHRLSRPP